MLSQAHRWDPKTQRPEFCYLFNARLQAGETMRVFPLSNWTEFDHDPASSFERMKQDGYI